MPRKFKGKQIFMEALMAEGVEYIFGNPGTTEMPIMDSLSDYPELKYILTLHESIAVGAAHYYAQATGKVGVVNVHVGPGLGNSLGMLYNAYEANTPLVLTAGQQDTRMRLREPLLGHDLVAMAAPLVKWSVQAEHVDELPHILHQAFKVAHDAPSGPVFLSLPINVMEEETEQGPFPPTRIFPRTSPDPEGVRSAAELLAHARRPAIICGDGVAFAKAQGDLVALAELIGAPVWHESLHHQINFPTSHPNAREGLRSDHAGVRQALGDTDTVLLVGGSFFEEVWHTGENPFPDGAALIQIESSPAKLSRNFSLNVGLLADPKQGLAALREAVSGMAGKDFAEAARQRNDAMKETKTAELSTQEDRAKRLWDNTPIAPSRLMAEIKAALPPDAVIVNESITAHADLKRTIPFEQGGDYYGTRGGGIGQGLPGAIGVKLASPERPVICLSGDGSAMYSIQALWTCAHHDIPVIFIILSNRTYRVLKINMNIYRQRFGLPGERPYPHMDLTDPEFGFVEIAGGFGVEGEQVTEPDKLAPALKKAFASGKPYLLDVVLDGKV